MKSFKLLFFVTLFCGISILAIGLTLQYVKIFADGALAGRFGDLHYGRVTGFSGIFIGVLLLLASVLTYRMYREEKKKFDKMK